MKKRYAVIDLGTNTFHILIAEKEATGLFKELYRKRIFINLAEDGIHAIGKAAWIRALNAMYVFKEILEEYQVNINKAFGTAALRTATNGSDFIAEVLSKTGIEIQLIPGKREAELIYKGVVQAVQFGKEMGLIMDIGGGSVEFIIADKAGVQWTQSFPVGVSVLFNDFHHSDPISVEEVTTLYHFLEQELASLLQQLKLHKPTILVGASGTFDVLEDMLCEEKISSIHGIVKVETFYPVFKQLLHTKLSERLAMPQIPETRAKMIIVALILIDFILNRASIQSISVSAYAMKEGMLSELIANK